MRLFFVIKKVTARLGIVFPVVVTILFMAVTPLAGEVEPGAESPDLFFSTGFSRNVEDVLQRTVLAEFQSGGFGPVIDGKMPGVRIRFTLNLFEKKTGELPLSAEGPGRYIMRSRFQPMVRLTVSLNRKGTTVTMNRSSSPGELARLSRNLAEKLRPLLSPDTILSIRPDSLPETDTIIMSQISRGPAFDLAAASFFLVPVGNFFDFSNAIAGYSLSLRYRGRMIPGLFFQVDFDHGFMLGERYYVSYYHLALLRLEAGLSRKIYRGLSLNASLSGGAAFHFLNEKSGRESVAIDGTVALTGGLEVYFSPRIIGYVSFGGGLLAEKSTIYGFLTFQGGAKYRFTW